MGWQCGTSVLSPNNYLLAHKKAILMVPLHGYQQTRHHMNSCILYFTYSWQLSTCNKHLKMKPKFKSPSHCSFPKLYPVILSHKASQLMCSHHVIYRKGYKITIPWQMTWYTLHSFKLKSTEVMPQGLNSQCSDNILPLYLICPVKPEDLNTTS